MTLTPGLPCTSRHCSCHFRHRTLPEVSPSCCLPSRHSPRAGTGPCLEYIWAGWTFLMLVILADAVAGFSCLCWTHLLTSFLDWTDAVLLGSLADAVCGFTCWCCRWTHVYWCWITWWYWSPVLYWIDATVPLLLTSYVVAGPNCWRWLITFPLTSATYKLAEFN